MCFLNCFSKLEFATCSRKILFHFLSYLQYNADGWLQASREDAASRSAGILLQESNKSNVSDLFLTSRGPMTSMSGSVAGLEGSHHLRRMSSMRRTFTSGQAGIKRNSVALQVKFQVDGLCEQLRRTKIHFVHCFLPQHGAGLCDIKGKTKVPMEEGQMNVPLVRSQVRLKITSNGEAFRYIFTFFVTKPLNSSDVIQLPTYGVIFLSK